MYLSELTAKPLSAEEEHELAVTMRAGNERARQQFIEANLRLVVSVAAHYVGNGLELADLVQYGNLTMLSIVDRYEPERGGRFSTFAYPNLRFAMLRAIRDHARLVRISRRQDEKIRRGEEAMIDVPLSLDLPYSDNGDSDAVEWADMLADGGEPVDEIVSAHELAERVRAAMATLADDQQVVLAMAYGQAMPLADVGLSLGRSYHWTWDRKEQGLAALRGLAERYGYC